jgi:hypothetical protein
MELMGSLPCSQDPTTDPYPEPEESSPHLTYYFFMTHFNINLPSTPKVISLLHIS